LIQIILSGQVQLEEKLKLPELNQLSQRVGFSCRLIPLDYEKTKGYIENRLSIAGVTAPLFTSKAIKAIYVHSKGIPRVINVICDLVLLFGSIDERREMGHTTIQEVMQDLNIYTPEQLRHRHKRPRQDTDVMRDRSSSRPHRWARMAASGVAW